MKTKVICYNIEKLKGMDYLNTLPNIELTKKELEYLDKNIYNCGAEGYVAISNKNTMYKIFRYDSSDIQTLENKKNKIIQLSKYDINGMTKPLSTLSINKEFIGYEMTYDSKDYEIRPELLNLKEKKIALLKLKKTLEQLKEKEIIYADINERNILINSDGKIKLCDIDNAQVGNYPIDIMASDAKNFLDSYTKGTDDKIHSYMHNLLTIRFLAEELFIEDEEGNIKVEEVLNKVLTKKGIDILEETTYPSVSYSGKYLINYLKKI